MQTAPRKAQRNTRQRALVMEIVRGSTAHPNAMAVCEEARKRLSRISLGTVYRILRVLQEEGRVQDVAEARASARFDARTDRHPQPPTLEHGHAACHPLGSGRSGRRDQHDEVARKEHTGSDHAGQGTG